MKPKPKRSVAEVDELPPRVREQLSAAALTASRGYIDAFDRVLKGQVESTAVLRSMRLTQIATLVLVSLLAVFVAGETFVRGHQLDALEKRVLQLEHP